MLGELFLARWVLLARWLLLRFGADDPAAHADARRNDDIETLAVPVLPDGSNRMPDGFAVAALLRLGYDVGDVCWFVSHGISFLVNRRLIATFKKLSPC
jgi:hypothetical protein